MFQKLKSILTGRFIINVVTVAAGTAAAQVITMLFSPLLTRLYGPELIGVQSVFLTVLGFFSVVAALTYPIAIVLPKSDVEANGLVRLSLFIGVVFSAGMALVLYFIGAEFVSLINAEEIQGYLFFIPLCMFFSVLSAVATQWLIRKKAFSYTAKVSVFQSILMGGARSVGGFLNPSVGVLIWINAVGSLFNAALLSIGRRRFSTRSCLPQGDDNYSLWRLAKRYSDFPLLRAPQVLLNTLSHGLPLVLLASLYGSASAGFYAIAISVLGVPAAIIGSSVSQVFYPQINEARQSGKPLRLLIVRTTLGMALVGLAPFMLIVAFGPWLFSTVFGAEWEIAGVYAQWLAIWLFFGYINKPAVAAIPVLKIQKGLLVYEFFSTGSKVLSLMAGYYIFSNDIAAVALFSIFGALAYIVLIGWVIRFAQLPPQRGEQRVAEAS